MSTWQLAWEFFLIGITTFGGGSSVVPIAHERIVNKKHLMSDEEFMEIVTLANLLPGPSMVEIAGGIGYRLGGKLSACICSLAISLPVMIMFVPAVVFLFNKLNPEVITKVILPTSIVFAASMFCLGYDMQRKEEIKLYPFCVMIGTIVLMIFFNISPVLIMFAMIGLSIIKYWIKHD